AKMWSGRLILDGAPAKGITSALVPARRFDGTPFNLASNAGRLYYASLVNGIGFVIEADEAKGLLRTNSQNEDVLFPYVGGEDVNSSPIHVGSRWIINFHDWPLSRAERYPDCLEIVRSRVKPSRDRLPNSKRRVRDNWWRYEHEATELYRQINGLDNVVAITSVSKWAMPAMVDAKNVFAHTVYVFASDEPGLFGTLSSAAHSWWTLAYASTLETRLRYTPSTVFETYPLPEELGPDWMPIAAIGERLASFRAEFMVRTGLGLTKTYNRMHNPDDHDPSIDYLRDLHVELDHTVRNAYGWSDLELDHHHWETPQGMRFTVSPEAKDELLDRLLELNHQRYAAEVAAGLHDKKAKKAPVKRKTLPADPAQDTLL
ncbi:MAG: type IIL restriction-modification enzyme MmeI, partial [Pirellulales bacterium]